MTKVALIYNQPLCSIDGASKVVSSFHDHRIILYDNGVDMSIFTPGKSLSVSIKSNGFSLKRIIKIIVFKLDVAGVIRYCYNLFYRSKKAFELYKTQSKEDYDVLFFHEIETCYHYLKNGKRKPVVLVLHTTGDFFSMELSYYPLLRYTLFYNILLKHIRKTILTNVDRIVFNSKMAADNFYKLYPNARKDLATYVNNGISDIDDKSLICKYPSTPPYTVVCVGSVTERKGQRYILNALRSVKPDVKECVRFLIVGDGNIKDELERKSRDWGLEKNLVFLGVQKDVVPFLSKANIFILPSVDEGMPIAILEAMRQGLPIVSTRVGGIPYQVIDKVTGIIIDASTEGVINFIKDIDRYDWDEMGRAARDRYVNEFSIEQMMEKYAVILKAVI